MRWFWGGDMVFVCFLLFLLQRSFSGKLKCFLLFYCEKVLVEN